MKLVGLALAALTVIGSSAQARDFTYPMDIEHNARWVVLDGLPEVRHGVPWNAEVVQLQTRNLVQGGIDIAAVCGRLDFKNPDDGLTNFVIYYSVDDQGVAIPVGRPYFYGSLPYADFDPQQGAAQVACGEVEATTVEASR